MPKARKKPVIVDYFIVGKPQEESINPLKEWIRSFGDNPDDVFSINTWGAGQKFCDIRVNTLEGSSYDVPAGYVIIRGVKGEYYPCEPEIFKQTYDLEW